MARQEDEQSIAKGEAEESSVCGVSDNKTKDDEEWIVDQLFASFTSSSLFASSFFFFFLFVFRS